MELTLAAPLLRLDPLAPDVHEEAAHLRSLGPVVPVEMLGEVTAWAVTRDSTARELMVDTARFAKDIKYWGAFGRGEVPPSWPLLGLVASGPNMLTTDGEEQRRLRTPLAREFTGQRVERLRSRVEEITATYLDLLAAQASTAPDGVVDLKSEFAFPLPMTVIGELLGVPGDWHQELHRLFNTFFDELATPEQVMATHQALHQALTDLIALRRAEPGDDLTSALVNRAGLTDAELVGTLQLMIAAGHETTVYLLINAVRALLAHPGQLAMLLDGTQPWKNAIEEVLRWDPPASNVAFRYATEDTEVEGVRIRQGEPVIISYVCMGRDPERYGENAHLFDITRPHPSGGHTSFGYGAHACIGAHLSRLEAAVALPALFARFPGLALAVPEEQVERTPSVIFNGRRTLPVRCGAPAGGPAADER
ncbi:cytochrome P450 [Sphaerisporangium sp. NPDC049002]|uniref:cytochrome P450 family protein n=1 Tax=unclassified Sphaerisporangium TaxID=2630420 RepID=UPI003403AD6B